MFPLPSGCSLIEDTAPLTGLPGALHLMPEKVNSLRLLLPWSNSYMYITHTNVTMIFTASVRAVECEVIALLTENEECIWA